MIGVTLESLIIPEVGSEHRLRADDPASTQAQVDPVSYRGFSQKTMSSLIRSVVLATG